jgi:plastocyanin
MSLSKKRLALFAVCFLVASSVAFAISFKLSSKQAKPVATTGLAQGTKENPYNIDLKKENKDPIDLLIKTGEYVQFNSKDGGEHQIIQGASTNTEHGATLHVPSPLDSGVIKADEGYLLQFSKTGKYEFHDNYDHKYTITIIAYDPNKKAEDNKKP